MCFGRMFIVYRLAAWMMSGTQNAREKCESVLSGNLWGIRHGVCVEAAHFVHLYYSQYHRCGLFLSRHKLELQSFLEYNGNYVVAVAYTTVTAEGRPRKKKNARNSMPAPSSHYCFSRVCGDTIETMWRGLRCFSKLIIINWQSVCRSPLKPILIETIFTKMQSSCVSRRILVFVASASVCAHLPRWSSTGPLNTLQRNENTE